MIRYDSTPFSVVVWCECGWREITVTRDAARAYALDHERNVHPESRQIRDALVMFRRRRSDAEIPPDG